MSVIGRIAPFIARALTYATWNPSDKGSAITLSADALSMSQTTASMVRGTLAKSYDKWYWEVTATAAYGAYGVANASATLSNYLASDANGWSWSQSGGCYNNNALSGSNAAFTTGDVLGFALDMGSGTLTMYKNGVVQPFQHTGLVGDIYTAAGNSSGTSSSGTANFGATPFAYTPPAGYNAGVYNN